MRKYNRISLAILIMIPLAEAYSQNSNPLDAALDEQTITNFAKAMEDPDILIGVFELPGFGQRVRSLKSGQIVELDPDYSNYVLNDQVVKLNLISSIKGVFDSVIFLQTPNLKLVPSEELVPKPIVPYSGSRWILLLKYGLDGKGKGTDAWTGKLASYGKPYFTRNTVFIVYSESNSSLCYKWTEDGFDMPSHVQFTSADVVDQLAEIYQIMQVAKNDKITRQSQLSDKLLSMKNAYARSIVKSILDHIEK